jgi:hypothetical protein
MGRLWALDEHAGTRAIEQLDRDGLLRIVRTRKPRPWREWLRAALTASVQGPSLGGWRV